MLEDEAALISRVSEKQKLIDEREAERERAMESRNAGAIKLDMLAKEMGLAVGDEANLQALSRADLMDNLNAMRDAETSENDRIVNAEEEEAESDSEESSCSSESESGSGSAESESSSDHGKGNGQDNSCGILEGSPLVPYA